MSRSGMMVAALGLLLQTATAFATPFEPVGAPRSTGGSEEQAEVTNRFNVGLAVASWSRDNIDETSQNLGQKFESKIRPLVTVDYQINSRFAVGAWYNPVAWDLEERWDQAPLPSGWTSAPGLLTSYEGTGSMYEIHGTYAFGNGWAAQLAYQDMSLDWEVKWDNPDFWVSPWAPGTKVGEDKSTKLVLWGTKSFAFGPEETKPWGVVLGLGIAQGLSGEYASRAQSGGYGSVDAKKATAHGLVGVSYAFTPRLSANASLWLADFSRDEEKSTRFQAGVSGRF